MQGKYWVWEMLPAQAGVVAILCTHYRSLVWRRLTSCPCRHRILVPTDTVLVHSDQVSYSREIAHYGVCPTHADTHACTASGTSCLAVCTHGYCHLKWNQDISEYMPRSVLFKSIWDKLISACKKWGTGHAVV
jgi:hypothetical protein